MKTQVVSFKEMVEDNPTLCLSPLRMLGHCHRCEHYRQKERKCNPRVKPEILALLEEKQRLLQRVREINRWIGLAENEGR